MYDIYIKNFYSPSDGAFVKDETRLYSIPISIEDRDNVLIDPSVSTEMGKTGSFEFTVHPAHPYYHSFAQMRTIMRVSYDGDTIFRGRALTIDNTLTGTKRIHCEGDMAFLLDSFQDKVPEEKRKKITIGKYIENVLEVHNAQMEESGEDDKKIYCGKIPGSYGEGFSEEQKIENKKDAYGSNNFEQSMNALESLISLYGGYFRTRYDETEKKCYLDWLKLWFRDTTENGQPIAITQNIIDAQSNSEVDNIFTALIPIGSKEGEDLFIDGYKTDIHGKNNKRILVPHLAKVYSDEELSTGYITADVFKNAVNQYGIIYKTQSFPNADTQEKLWKYACDWIKNNYVGGITGYNLTAVDMHHVDHVVAKYLVGDKVNLIIPVDVTGHEEYVASGVTSGNIKIARTLTSVKYTLHNPEKNTYDAGVPCDILNRDYGTKSTSKSSSGSGKGAGQKAGGKNNHDNNNDNDQEAIDNANNALAWKIIIDEKHNNSQYQALLKKSGGKYLIKPALQAAQVTVKKALSGEVDQGDVASIILDAQNSKISVMNPFEYKEKYGFLPVKGNPAFQQVAQLEDTFVDAFASLTINGTSKAFGLTGKNSGATSAVIDLLKNTDIPEDASPEDIYSIVNNKMKDANIQLPNMTVNMQSKEGSDGSQSGLLQMGRDAVTGFVNNLTADSSGNEGTGSVNVGKESQNSSWYINLNEPLKWKDSNGNTHTLPKGTIESRDFAAINEALDPSKRIPSFNTKIAVIDEALIGVLHVGDLDAINATIENLTATVANIDTLISNKINSVMADAILLNVNALHVRSSFLMVDPARGSEAFATWQSKRVMLGNGTVETLYYLGRNY